MSLEKAKSIRIDWERSGAKRLKMSKRPVSDFHNNELAEPATLVAFRDTFHSHEPLNKEVYYFLLIEFYRIVWITKEEDDRLNKKHRSWRPESTYRDLGIEIKGDEQWENLGE